MSSAFPGDPKVSLALERYISRPLDSQVVDKVPDVSLLEVFQTGLNNLKKNADRRVESSQEGVRVGTEVTTKARRKLKLHVSSGKAEHSHVGQDEGRKIKSKEKDTPYRHSSGTPRDVDPASKSQGERKANGHGHWAGNLAVKSPVQAPRIKRELSGSPDPTESSSVRHALAGDPNRTTPVPGAVHKKKKRKVMHELSPETPLREMSHRGSSPYVDPVTERASVPPREREQSVRSVRLDSPSLSTLTTGPPHLDNRIPSPRPSLPLSASTGGAPKIKLKISNNKAITVNSPNASSSDHSVQQFINPNLSFSPLRPGITNPTTHASSSRSVIPPRQPIPAPAPPQPRRQKDVDQDFSTVKNVAQTVQWSTFWSGIETYIRDVGEEDVAMLTFRPDDRGIYDMPALGRHYQDIWDEEDMQLPFSQASNQAWVTSANMASGAFQREKERDALGNRIGKGLRRAYPKDLNEVDLRDERKGPGLLEERIVAGLWEGHRSKHGGAASGETDVQKDTHEVVVKGEPGIGPVQDVDMEPRTGSGKLAGKPVSEDGATWPIASRRINGVATSGQPTRLDMMNATIGETEEGVKRELRHLGLLDANEEIDWTRKEDDEIAAALRQCQRALRDQIASNNARKERLTGLVKDRLAFGGYEKTLEGLEKAIESTWLKRSARKNKKQKSSSHREDGNSARRPGEKVPLPENVKQAMEARRRWIDVVGAAMQAPDVQGRFTGLPERSIYAEMEDLKGDAAGRTWIQTMSSE